MKTRMFLYKIYMKAQKHASFHAFSPVSASINIMMVNDAIVHSNMLLYTVVPMQAPTLILLGQLHMHPFVFLGVVKLGVEWVQGLWVHLPETSGGGSRGQGGGGL